LGGPAAFSSISPETFPKMRSLFRPLLERALL
jgi:hypothetical protein